MTKKTTTAATTTTATTTAAATTTATTASEKYEQVEKYAAMSVSLMVCRSVDNQSDQANLYFFRKSSKVG